MADDFRSLISALWAKLKLGSPTFGAGQVVALSIDGQNVTLEESPDGRHVLVSGSPGRLAADPMRRAEQVRLLLKANLGFLQSNRAGVFLETTEETARVRVQAIYPYSAASQDRLTGLIEDVLQRLEIHTADLANEAGIGATARTGRPAFTPVSHEEFIFRA